MKLRGLLIAALLLAGLSGLVYWSNQREKANEGKPDPDAAPKIIKVEKETLARIEIQKTGEPALTLEKGEDGKWKVTAPEALRADESSVDSLVSALSDLSSNRLVEESAADLSPFGLDQPKLTVVARQKDGKEIKLLVGDETPTSGNFFVKREDDPRVFTLASWNKTSLEKSPWDLRDKRLLTYDADKLSRVALRAKGQTVEIGKNANNEWAIVGPKPFRADGGAVEQLLSRLRDARMDTQMSADEMKKAAAAFAKAKPVASAKVTDAAGSQEIEVRKAGDNEYYAKSSAVEGIHKISSYVAEGLDKGLDDLRNKKLFDFGFNDPSRIEIRAAGKVHAFEKKDDKWMKDGKQMDSVSVRALIDELRDLAAQSFPESGFTSATIEAKVVSDDGKRVEEVAIAKSGDSYIARRANEPSLYELKAVDVDRLQARAEEVKEHQEGSKEKKEEKKEE